MTDTPSSKPDHAIHPILRTLLSAPKSPLADMNEMALAKMYEAEFQQTIIAKEVGKHLAQACNKVPDAFEKFLSGIDGLKHSLVHATPNAKLNVFDALHDGCVEHSSKNINFGFKDCSMRGFDMALNRGGGLNKEDGKKAYDAIHSVFNATLVGYQVMSWLDKSSSVHRLDETNAPTALKEAVQPSPKLSSLGVSTDFLSVLKGANPPPLKLVPKLK